MPRWGAGLSVAFAVVVFAVFALVLGRGTVWLDGSTLRGLTASQRANEIDAMRGYLIQVGAGVLAVGALLHTALNFQLARATSPTGTPKRSSSSAPSGWTCGLVLSTRWSAS
jgi:hypothetical protein